MHVRCNNQNKSGADRENILGQPMLFEYMGICVLSSAHESKMRGYLVYVLIVKKILSSILFKFSHSILDWTVLSWMGGGGVETFLEGSVNHIICRDYIVNRRFSIYCSLASCVRLQAANSCGVITLHLAEGLIKKCSFNLLCVLDFFQNAGSQLCFRFLLLIRPTSKFVRLWWINFPSHARIC